MTIISKELENNDMVPIWRKILRDNFTCLEKLSAFLDLNQEKRSKLLQNKAFPLNLPLRLAKKIEKKTLNDPILKQFVPTSFESIKKEGFLADPVSDLQASCSVKALQKYSGRILLLTSRACAMHCRYCFRQKYPYSTHIKGFEEELRHIKEDGSLKEVILSGGDPLSLSNNELRDLIEQLSSISHVKRLRFHTRFPIGIPERIDNELLSILEVCPLQIWMIIHCNHSRELDDDVLLALKNIQKLGIPVLNQAVLLKDVNDSIDVLQELCEVLIDHAIYPYYLHQLDRVEGAHHFEVDIETGKNLIFELGKRLPGYGLPKYVQEIAFEASKTLII